MSVTIWCFGCAGSPIIWLTLPDSFFASVATSNSDTYLDDVLRRVLAGETDWSAMTPHTWRSEHPESIRQYRQDERRQAVDRKKTRRARRRLLSTSTGRS